MRRGRWAVVLGASVGSGAAIAREAAAAGLNVFAVHRGRHAAEAEQVASVVRGAGRRYVEFTGDASTEAGARQGVRALLDEAGAGSVQLFVHSLASASVGRLATTDEPLVERQIERTFRVMAHSFVYWIRALHQDGALGASSRLVGLDNPLAESLIVDCGLIAATKGALAAYVRALAAELGPLGHRVNLLKYATVLTPAVEQVYGDGLARAVATHERIIPAGRMLTTEEVGRLVVWLCSDAAEWFNGATIDYTGGMVQTLADHALIER